MRRTLITASLSAIASSLWLVASVDAFLLSPLSSSSIHRVVLSPKLRRRASSKLRSCNSSNSANNSNNDISGNINQRVLHNLGTARPRIRSAKQNIPRRITALFSAAESNQNDNNNTGKRRSRTEAASSAAGDVGTTDSPPSATLGPDGIPSYRRLVVFTATTILIWISEPLLSLVDTTFVGMFASAQRHSAVVQIAALGPATTLYDSAIYMTYFLAIAATNQLAPALAKGDWKQLRRSTSHLMGLALGFGALVLAVTFAFGHSIIGNMVGPKEASLIPLAVNYAKIRAAVAPFCVVDFVAQSFCLATLDTKTPAIAVAVASLVNLVGDWWLTPLWGIQGAAVATAMATLSSCAILVNKVRRQTSEWKILQQAEEHSTKLKTRIVDGKIEIIVQPPHGSSHANKTATTASTSSSSSSEGESDTKPNCTDLEITAASDSPKTNQIFYRKQAASQTTSIRGTKQRSSREIPFFSLPDRKSLVDLLKLAGPIFFVMMGKIACYSIMTVRATSFGILPLAAHNIMMRVFFFFSCFGDSVSQAAQTFFPQVSMSKRGPLVRRLLYLAVGVGFIISQSSFFILRFLGGALTKDKAILGLMADYAPFVGFAVLLHPFIMFLEGAILAKRDLAFLVAVYLSTMALHFSFVFWKAATFDGLWRAFFVFQAIRLVHFGGRVWQQSWQEQRRRRDEGMVR